MIVRFEPQRGIGTDLTTLQGDFLDVRRVHLDNVSPDLIMTSPPYNLDKDYGSDTSDNREYGGYLTWSWTWLRRALMLSKQTTRLCLNVPLDKNLHGHQPVYTDLVHSAIRAGWKYVTTIIWNEQNISRRTAWGSWKSPSAPHVITPVEMIAVFHAGEWERRERERMTDLTRDEFMAWTNGVWTFPGESAKRIGHPSPFPVELPKRCIKLFTYVGDRVLDPFMGSGTTLVACQNLHRIGVGVELNRQYVRLTHKRLWG